MRRAEAIYSIHGRANTNLRLDVQTAPSLPIFSTSSFTYVHFSSFSLAPSPFSISISTLLLRPAFLPYRSPSVPPLLPLDRLFHPPRVQRRLVICYSSHAHTTPFLLVRVRVSAGTVFRISETGPLDFRLVKIRSTLNLVGNYYPIFRGTSVVTLDLCPPPFSPLRTAPTSASSYFSFFSSSSSPFRCFDFSNLCYAAESISLAAIVTFLRPRAAPFSRQTALPILKNPPVRSTRDARLFGSNSSLRCSTRESGFRGKRSKLRDLVIGLLDDYRYPRFFCQSIELFRAVHGKE